MFTKTPCHDCDINTLPMSGYKRAEFYMVKNWIWRRYGAGSSYLCIGCLEARMGRQLKRSNFTDCKLNDLEISDTPRYAWSYRTPRLVERLSA